MRSLHQFNQQSNQPHGGSLQAVAVIGSTFIQWRTLVIATLLACACLTSPAKAEDVQASSTLHQALFIPEHFVFAFPSHQQGISKDYKNVKVLDNQQLELLASHLLSNEMSTSQRALNHQWLQHYSNGNQFKEGSRGVAHLFRLGAKTYLHRSQNSHLTLRVLSGEQHGAQLNEQLNYGMRMSGDEINLSFTFEF